MKSPWKLNRGRLVLRREQLRQLDTAELARLRGGGVAQVYSAGACTETCTACAQTTQTGPDALTKHCD
jgi:hypothetical protein